MNISRKRAFRTAWSTSVLVFWMGCGEAGTASQQSGVDTDSVHEREVDEEVSDDVPSMPSDVAEGTGSGPDEEAPEPPSGAAAALGAAEDDNAKKGSPAQDVRPPVAPADFSIAPKGHASFLIDAPLEKVKGSWRVLGGSLHLHLQDLGKVRGEVTLDLRTLKTNTFDDAEKNATQTEHALNWMEIGEDVSQAERSKYATARFTLTSMQALGERNLLALKPTESVDAVVKGGLSLHGIVSDHSARVTIRREKGSGDKPTLRIKTKRPLQVSLKRHDIKPRDLAGRFLAGALEKVGEKISDTVQVQLTMYARPK